MLTYQFNDNFDELNVIPDYTKGNILQTCVHIDDDNNIFKIVNFHNLDIFQANAYALNLIMYSVINTIYTDLIDTSYKNTSNQICKFNFELLGQFFERDQPEYLSIVGTTKVH